MPRPAIMKFFLFIKSDHLPSRGMNKTFETEYPENIRAMVSPVIPIFFTYMGKKGLTTESPRETEKLMTKRVL